jgi:hypothetical protein
VSTGDTVPELPDVLPDVLPPEVLPDVLPDVVEPLEEVDPLDARPLDVPLELPEDVAPDEPLLPPPLDWVPPQACTAKAPRTIDVSMGARFVFIPIRRTDHPRTGKRFGAALASTRLTSAT